MNFIVVEIGCLECGIPSSLVGRFETEEEATAFTKQFKYASDIAYRVFDLTKIEEPMK